MLAACAALHNQTAKLILIKLLRKCLHNILSYPFIHLVDKVARLSLGREVTDELIHSDTRLLVILATFPYAPRTPVRRIVILSCLDFHSLPVIEIVVPALDVLQLVVWFYAVFILIV